MLKGGSEHGHSLKVWLWTAREWWGVVGGQQGVEEVSLNNVNGKEDEGKRTIKRRSLMRRDHRGQAGLGQCPWCWLVIDTHWKLGDTSLQAKL